ncbi:hypothetical protein HA402_002923 [Bradysia odoriphaga]|nr:hypothetical protein HA402_002923 [Bradysia odoriphaga]
MKIFRVTSIDENDLQNGGRNEVQLNAYNLIIQTNALSDQGSRKISFSQLTKEVLPSIDNYRRSFRAKRRPSLSLLHGEDLEQDLAQEPIAQSEAPDEAHHGIKLGWIQGVLVPCLLNIWGVMLFLRLSWVVAQAGMGLTFVIILLSYIVTVVTTLSLSAICTNGEVKGGGVYFLISRSLGPEFGASVGLVFAFANTVAASMNTIGFCDSLNELLGSYDIKIIDGGENDTRIIGTIALVIMIVICAIGMDWESKAQNFLIAIILVAIFNFLVGTAIGPNDELSQAQGFVGFHAQVFRDNFGPDFRFSEGQYHDFFSVFAIFFPSVTGLQAGANICGDLKNPATAIPKGTLLALLVSATSYVSFVFFAGSAGLRQASGNITDLIDGSGVGMQPECLLDNSCEYGLHNSYTIMHLMSGWAPLIFAGTWAATLCTALTNLLSVPRLLQALGRDRIYPGLIFFSKGYGRHGEPYRGYALTLLISTVFLLIGTDFVKLLFDQRSMIFLFSNIANLNVIAPLITTFYLASYALINFCTFHGAFIKPLGWRPTFKYHNVWLSLIGFVMCLVIMFLINWIASLVTCAIVFVLYLVVIYRKPDVNWGSSQTAQTYRSALSATYRLKNTRDHVKNYRPQARREESVEWQNFYKNIKLQILVLAGSPELRPPLVDFASLVTKHKSLMIVGSVAYVSGFIRSSKILSRHESHLECNDLQGNEMPHHARMNAIDEGNKWLKTRKIRAFYNVVNSSNFESGANALVQTSGIGKLTPNFVLIGYKYKWQTSSADELLSYYRTIHVNNSVKHRPSSFTNQIFFVEETEQQFTETDRNLGPYQDYFYTAKENAVIDVWWLYDDGGLTILVPYILSMRSKWKHCKIRVFALDNHKMEHRTEEQSIAKLLTKLRITYSSLTLVSDISSPPQQHTVDFHKSLLAEYMDTGNAKCFVSNIELIALESTTHRQLRLRELLLEHSKESSLVVMSLPIPREVFFSHFLALIEA